MDKNTIDILKNFSSINQSIQIYAGNQLATMATTKNIFASAVVATEFPRDFAIYNLPEFLSVLSLFSEPKIEYGENDITIKEGKMKVRYQYSSPAVVVSPPKGKSIPVRDVLLTFDLKKEDLAGLVKASAILKATDLIIDQNSMSVTNRKGNDNTYKIDIEAAEGDTDRSFALKVEYLKLIPNDYRVQVNERVLNFTNEEKQLSYTFTLDRD